MCGFSIVVVCGSVFVNHELILKSKPIEKSILVSNSFSIAPGVPAPILSVPNGQCVILDLFSSRGLLHRSLSLRLLYERVNDQSYILSLYTFCLLCFA